MGEAKRRLCKLGLAAVAVCLVAATAQAATQYCIEKDRTLYGNLNQNDPLMGAIGPFACAPVAAVNSFVYLEKAYPGIYNRQLIPDADGDGQHDKEELVAVALNLAGGVYMNTLPPGGTWDDMFIWGKLRYFEDMGVAQDTIFGAQMSGVWGHPRQGTPDQFPAGARPDWVADGMTPTWEFIYDNLRACEDVEVLIVEGDWGHFLTVTSFCFNDADDDGFIDPVWENNNIVGSEATLDYINPCGGVWGSSIIWQDAQTGALQVHYQTHQGEVILAVKESPIPEPLTVLGVMLGVSSLAAYIRRRRLSA